MADEPTPVEETEEEEQEDLLDPDVPADRQPIVQEETNIAVDVEVGDDYNVDVEQDVEFNEGDEVIIKAGIYRRGGNYKFFHQGDQITLTEDDAARSDAALIFQHLDSVEEKHLPDPDVPEDSQPIVQEPPEVGAGEAPADFSFSQPDYDQLVQILENSNVTQAKDFLSQPGWTADGMAVATEAETAGKARVSVTEFADARYAELKEKE